MTKILDAEIVEYEPNTARLAELETTFKATLAKEQAEREVTAEKERLEAERKELEAEKAEREAWEKSKVTCPECGSIFVPPEKSEA